MLTLVAGVRRQLSLCTSPSAGFTLSAEELAAKKVTLPYLDQLEYIRLQIERRTQKKEATVAVTTGFDSEKKAAIEVATVETPSQMIESKGATTMSSGQWNPPGSAASALFAARATPTILRTPSRSSKRRRVDNDDNSFDNSMMTTVGSVEERESQVDNMLLLKKYPRFCKLFAQHSKGTLPPYPRQRQKIWVLQLMEKVYDERYQYQMEQGYRPGQDDVDEGKGAEEKSGATAQLTGKKRKERPKAFTQKLLKSKIPMSFPEAVYIYISKVHGLADLVTQACWDLLYSVETLSVEWPELELFGMFLRELYDTDVCLFFLHVRNITQTEFGLSLKHKDKQLDHFVISDNSLFLTADPRLPDKTQIIWLSEAACLLVAKRLFGKESIAKFYLYTIDEKFVNVDDSSARILGLRDGGSSARLVAAAKRESGGKTAHASGAKGTLK